MLGRERYNTPPGPAIDGSGQAVVDPSSNVNALVAMSERRMDDLRETDKEHFKEMFETTRYYENQLRDKESARIDANRLVDKGAVESANVVYIQQQATLAAQVGLTADAARTSLGNALEPIQKDIAEVRKTQYEAAGRSVQVIESRGHNTNIGLWVSIGIAGFIAFMAVNTFLLTTIGLGVALWLKK